LFCRIKIREKEDPSMIYADNAATTRLSATALAAMLPYLTEQYGNPSSLYTLGQTAATALAQARETVARCLHCRPEEIVFTSGGSEADNQAILSAARWGKRQGKTHIISTAFEHHAVLHTLQKLEKEGFTVTLLDVHADGRITPQQVEAAITQDTCLVTVMYANNEIGTIQPIGEIGAICRARKVPFHTDAVQAAGHLAIDVGAEQIDMLSLSAHKFHGPKGVGALYVRKGVPLLPLIEGGAQERRKRAGTENVAGIVGLAAALQTACDHLEANAAKVAALRDRIIDGLAAIPHAALNGDRDHRLPGNVNVCFEGIEGESLLLLLDDRGICASSGSACTSGSLDPSHVLLAIGRPHEVAHGSLRLSLCEENTEAEVDAMLREIPKVVEYLRNMSPVWRELQKGARDYVIQ
jgi:cysteine desulfurase